MADNKKFTPNAGIVYVKTAGENSKMAGEKYLHILLNPEVLATAQTNKKGQIVLAGFRQKEKTKDTSPDFILKPSTSNSSGATKAKAVDTSEFPIDL